jgi:hypothetical protein
MDRFEERSAFFPKAALIWIFWASLRRLVDWFSAAK